MLKDYRFDEKTEKYICPYCEKQYTSRGIAPHIWKSHGAGKDIKSGHPKGQISWRKGLTKNTDKRIEKGAKTLNENLASGKIVPFWLGKHHSVETKKKISDTAKHNPNAGGYRRGSGRGKSGWYKGYWCDSSWELAFVIYHLDHKILFERNNKGFEYEFEGKLHKYYPDFIYEDGTYIEIKGYKTEKNDVKISQFKDKLKVWYNKDVENMLFYCKRFYGKDFIKLYEKGRVDSGE